MWAYFTMKSGWLKTSAGTDMEPQNYAYLYPPLVWLKSLHLSSELSMNALQGLVVYLVISDSFQLQICLDKESKSNITILIGNGGLS